MEAYPGQTRLYVVVGSMLGLMIGVFMHSFLLEAGSSFRLAWLAVFAAIGAVMGKLVVVAQAPGPTESEESSADDSGGGTDESATTRFFKLQSGVYDHDELRRLRVRSVTMPMSPPDSEVALQVRDYDLFARVPVLPGVLEKLTVEELFERVVTEACGRAPKVPGELDLKLVSYYSEGPVADDGRAPLGWSFHLVDGAAGLGCRATAAADEIVLDFYTAATFSEVGEWEWLEIGDLLEGVAADLPDWLAPKRVRVHLPSEVVVYSTDPLRIAQVDAAGGSVLNRAHMLEREAAQDDGERFDLEELLAWTRGEDPPDESDLGAALEDDAFGDGLRTFKPRAMERVALGLARHHGPSLAERLVDAIAASEEVPNKLELVQVLARCPGARALSALHRVGLESEIPEFTGLCQTLHDERRRGLIDVPQNPLDPLSFLDVRRHLGRGAFRVVTLLPSYNPERDFFPQLETLGFTVRRRRLLSGDANLLVGAQLQTEDQRTELILTSTPLPVPCHILHIVGDDAEGFERRLERTEISYPMSQIAADVHSDHPHRVHRASLYVAALRLDREDLVPHLIQASERGKHDPNLRRATLRALSVQSAGVARAHLEALATDPLNDDCEFVAGILEEPALTGSVPRV